MGKCYTYSAFLRRPTDGVCCHYDIDIDYVEGDFMDFPTLLGLIQEKVCEECKGFTLITLTCTGCQNIK